MKHTILMLATAAAVCAQSTVQGPQLGWVFESGSGSIRAVRGVAGSSTLGQRIDLGVSLTSASVAPNGGWAIATSADDGQMLFLDTRNAAPRPVAVRATPSANDVIFSPSGSAAILVYQDARKITLLGGLPAGLSVVRDIEFAGAMPDALAVSDDGKSILTSGPDGVTAFDGDGNQWSLNFAGTAQSVVYLHQSHDALLSNERGLWLVRNADGNATSRLVWEGSARAAIATADRRSAVVLDQDNGLQAVNLELGGSRAIECACQPAMLARLTDTVFRLNSLGDGPLWLVDLNGQEPRTVFVPADFKSDQ